MAIQDIQAMYDKLYSSKYNDLLKKKNQSIQDLEGQQSQVNNQYQDLYNSLNQKKLDTQNQYKTLYSGLDNQYTQGQQKFYNDRNSVDVGVNQNLARLKEMMAAKGWTQGGENMQAQLQANTDRSNGLGQVRTNETSYNQGINDKRNQYSLQEQGIYNDIGNQVSAAEREKTQRISDLVDKIRLANESFAGDEQALKDSIDAQKIKDINDYNERLRQEAVQAAAQRAAVARSNASRSSNGLSNSMSSGSTYNKSVSDINDVVNGQYNLSEKQRVLQRYMDDLQSQNGNEAAVLYAYAKQALDKVNQQMSNFVNSGRYAGYENRRM